MVDIANQQGLKGFIFGIVSVITSIISIYIFLFLDLQANRGTNTVALFFSFSAAMAFLFAGLNLSIRSLETIGIEQSERYIARSGGEISQCRWMGFYLNFFLLAFWAGFWIYLEVIYMSVFLLLVIILKISIIILLILQRKIGLSFDDGRLLSIAGIILGIFSVSLIFYNFTYVPTILDPGLLGIRTILATVFSIITCVVGFAAAGKSTDIDGNSLSYTSLGINGTLILIWIGIGISYLN